MIRSCRLAPVAAILVLLSIGIPLPAATQTIKELQRKLAERDAHNADLARQVEALSRRVEALERINAIDSREGNPPAHTEAASPPVPGETANGPSPAARPNAAAEPPSPTGPAPGQFTIDDEVAQRALERALVQTGALLLDVGAAEIEPRFSYARESRASPVFVGEDAVANLESRRNQLQTGLSLRFGLPFSSQVEFDLPYVYEDQSGAIAEEFEASAHATGLGDFSVTLSKVLLRESGWRPDLTTDIQWNSDTGTTRNGTNLGSGFNELTASLWTVKRIDPLAFFGRVSYTTAFEKNNISPGDSFGISVGTVLATSPDTSLRFSLDQSFENKVEVDGQEVPGSDEVISSLTIGGSIIFGLRSLVDVSATIGLTPGAPDYASLVSLPIGFDLPILSNQR